TLHTMKLFVKESFRVSKDRTFVVTGYAKEAGQVKENLPLVEAARDLGKQMITALTG
ncbi:MAG: hypothetical protein HY670_07025, partial [Chloroflexi bacterium]|nr:hypothetical protein [Chloroflexota bacterium]